VRATFRGFFENDLMPQGLPQVRLAIFTAVVLVMPALQVPLHAWGGYERARRLRPEVLDMLMWPHKLLFVTFVMMTTAMIALVVWDNIFPERREVFVIGHLPIRARTIILARMGAVVLLLALICGAAAVPSAFMYGVVAGGYSPGGILRTIAAHFVATMAAGAFAFLLLLAAQGLMLNLIPHRWAQRAMTLLQFVFMIGALASMALMPYVTVSMERAFGAASAFRLSGRYTPISEAAATAALSALSALPPAWFLGLYEVLAGTSRPLQGLAWRAAVSLAILTPLAFGLFALGCRTLMRRAAESKETEIGAGVLARTFLGVSRALCARSGPAEAVAAFTVLTLNRSRKHRMLFTLAIGAGATIALIGALLPLLRGGRLATYPPPVHLLSVVAVLIFFGVSGLRMLLGIPAELPANWIFRLADAEDARAYLRGALTAMFTVGVAIPILLLLPLHVAVWGPSYAAKHSLFWLIAGGVWCQILIVGYQRIPFTVAYAPPLGRVRLMWPLALLAYINFCYTLTALERDVMAGTSGFVSLVAVFGVLFAGVWWWRTRAPEGPPALIFPEEEEDAPVLLQLGA
jgi:hypothetical protein